MIALHAQAAGGVVEAARERGLIVITAGKGDVVRLVPPLIITDDDVDAAVSILADVLNTTLCARFYLLKSPYDLQNLHKISVFMLLLARQHDCPVCACSLIMSLTMAGVHGRIARHGETDGEAVV
jgi:hypothetical protein